MIIVGGTSTNGIDEGLAKALSAELIKVEHKVFPDGESYIRIPQPQRLQGEEVVVVQSTYYPQDKNLMELLFMIEAVKDFGASKVIAVIPYLAYARQDKRFREGEALSIKTVLRSIKNVGADVLITVEPHKAEELNHFSGETRIVYPEPLFAEELAKIVDKPFVLSPDVGALFRAKMVAEKLNCDYAYIEKERDRITGEITAKNIPRENLKDKDVIIVDDIISTGGTTAQAAKIAYSLGARRVIAAAAHVLMIGEAKKKIQESNVKLVIGTNTVPKVMEDMIYLDVSKIIAEKI